MLPRVLRNGRQVPHLRGSVPAAPFEADFASVEQGAARSESMLRRRVMADERELRTAMRAYLRRSIGPEGLAEVSEERFERIVEIAIAGGMGTVFRKFHDERD